ncbi:MAG: NAD-binding protein [Elusimicrobiota bacterium]
MDSEMTERLRGVLVALLAVLFAGTMGYTLIEGWPPFDSLYMTIITLATIGFGEVHPLSTAGRVFTIVLSLCGLGVMAYSFSTLTAFIVEGQLTDVLRRRKMESRIRTLDGHYIVCGAGYTGMTIIRELVKIGRPFVAIELNDEKAAHLQQEGHLVIRGDAMHDEVLERAGIKKARGLFCVVDNDRDNVFVALTARGLNPLLRIVSEVNDERVRDKLLRSGADAVVSSTHIGGLRLASEMVRPAAVGFLDSMIRDKDSAYRFEEVHISEDSSAVGRPFGSIEIRGGRPPLVLGVKESGTGRYVVNPPKERPLQAGEYLVVLGDREEVARLQKSIG